MQSKKAPASFAFIVFKQKLLLMHRDDIPTIPDPNCWGLIGGHAYESETPLETLTRETKEETNLEIKKIEFLREVDIEGHQQFIYLAKPTEEELQQMELGDEGDELKFFSFEELHHIKLTAALAKGLKNRPERFKELLED